MLKTGTGIFISYKLQQNGLKEFDTTFNKSLTKCQQIYYSLLLMIINKEKSNKTKVSLCYKYF